MRRIVFGRSTLGSNTGDLKPSCGLNRRRGPLEAYLLGPNENAAGGFRSGMNCLSLRALTFTSIRRKARSGIQEQARPTHGENYYGSVRIKPPNLHVPKVQALNP